ncbi:hypothetical protein H0R92_10760 [Treponema sp. OMZ 840]|uniref:tetratricopeptide repeat protein n=1 Tax=Treponema sp. OMZ 840 TaxID=244313 RepID=UPI003D93892D
MKIKSLFSLCILFCLLCPYAFADTDTAEPAALASAGYRYGEDLVYGLEAYKNKDWSNALFFLRKAAGVRHTSSEEIWLLMILSEMNVNDYYAVIRDADIFKRRFPLSPYIPHVEYQTQLARFGLELYEDAAKGFSSFISQYPGHTLIPSALFWTAESLYRLYEYGKARPLYKRVVDEYPESQKYAESMYRLELLKQREREEKLLYLLRVTGEEAAAAREDYERQNKVLQSEETIQLKRKVQKLEEQVEMLQNAYEESQRQNAALNLQVKELLLTNDRLSTEAAEAVETARAALAPPVAAQDQSKEAAPSSEYDAMIAELKQKAQKLEKLLNPQGGF